MASFEGKERRVSFGHHYTRRECGDPMDALIRYEREALIDLLLVIAEVSQLDRAFLMAYFDYGPGGTERVSYRDFGSKFCLSQDVVADRVNTLLERLRNKAASFGCRKDDFC